MNEIIVIGPQDYRAKLKEHVSAALLLAQAKLKYAQDLVVHDDAGLEGAMKDFVAWRAEAKDLEDERKSMTVPINAVLDEINAAFKEPAEIIKEARTTVERKGKAYEAVKESARQKAEQEARERARKEEERIRKEKEAQEAEWRRKEAQRRAEAERLENEAKNAKSVQARAKAEDDARKAREEADKAAQKAEERKQQAAEAFVPSPTIEKTEVKVSGAKKITRWYARVMDPVRVPVEWAGRILRPVDEGILNEIARGLKSSQSPIPGVSFHSEEKMS